MSAENQPPNYPSIIERNFVAYTVDDNPAVRYLRHPSGIIVVTLSANSELIDKPLTSIEWEVSGKKGHGVDRSKLAVSGKSKRVRQRLNVFLRGVHLHYYFMVSLCLKLEKKCKI